MAVTRTISQVSYSSENSSGSSNGFSPLTTTSSGGGILANPHEAPKKPIKPADSSFKSALRSAFIPQQPGRMMKHNGKPLGKSFKRTEPLATHGHEGGEILKYDPRGEKASVGDGIVLETSDFSEDSVNLNGSTPLSPTDSAASSSLQSSSPEDSQASETDWDRVARGRSNTTSQHSMARSTSRTSQGSSNNPCTIKFAPLPTSGRLKRANSITIGVAARSHLLQSQGSARPYDNSAAWQAQSNAQRSAAPRPSGSVEASRQQDEYVDLGEEIRKGALKAWRKVKRGGSVSSSNEGSCNEDGSTSMPPVGRTNSRSCESVREEERQEVSGDETPIRSSSPTGGKHDHSRDEGDGTLTPRRHSLQRRQSTGTFIGNNAFMEIEEKRKREARGDDNEDEAEESARFAEALGRTHASRVYHHTHNDKWHPGMRNVQHQQSDADGSGKMTDVNVVEGDSSESEDDFHEAPDPSDRGTRADEDDEEAREAERMADEALKAHSEKATRAGAVEKMERKK